MAPVSAPEQQFRFIFGRRKPYLPCAVLPDSISNSLTRYARPSAPCYVVTGHAGSAQGLTFLDENQLVLSPF
jgi:hypothetical protein